MRVRFIPNAYRYERNFEDDAALSNDSYLSETALASRKRHATEAEDLDAKVDRTFKRLSRMREEECTICLKALGDSPEDLPSFNQNLLPNEL